MKQMRVTIPEIALIAGTRVALGAGIALLFGDRLTREQRRATGLTLFLAGAISTVPLMVMLLGKRR